MRGLAGFLLLATGLGFGAYSYDPSLFANAPRIALAKAEAGPMLSAGQTAMRPTESVDGVRVFSPRSPLFSIAGADPEPRAASGTAASAASARSPVTDVAEASSGPVTRPVGDWTTTIAPSRGSRPTDPEARADLVRQLQTELKRVGCYEGDIDGSWGPGSRRAIATFTERINASLPNEEPDFILLTLVQGHRATACGACPSGESLSDGKCVPKAVIASAARPKRGKADAHKIDKGDKDLGAAVVATSPSPVTTVAQKPAPATPASPQVTEIAPVAALAPPTSDVVKTIATPSPDTAALAAAATLAAAAKQAAPSPAKRGVDVAATTTAAVTPTKTPTAPAPAIRKAPATVASVDVGAPDVARPAAVVRPVEPLPGRMTVGGPVIESKETPAAPVTTAPAAADDDEDATAAKQHHRVAVPRAPRAVPAPQPRVVHTPPPPRAHVPAPRIVHTPPPRREVQRPQPPPRVASAPAPSSSSQRQRAMVYNLFQRPDRY